MWRRAVETPCFFGRLQVQAGAGESRPYACLAWLSGCKVLAASPQLFLQPQRPSARRVAARVSPLWEVEHAVCKAERKLQKLMGKKIKRRQAGYICSMMLFMLPCFCLLLSTFLLTLSSHRRRHLVFAYTVSPVPVSNPLRSLTSCLCLVISFSEQLLCRALPPGPFFVCS